MNIKIIDPGHSYELKNFEKMYEGLGQVGDEDEDLGYGNQVVNFIHKEPKVGSENGEMELIRNGTTNEAVIEMMIDRMKWLDNKMPSDFNKVVIKHLEEVMVALAAITQDLVSRGVEGKHLN